MVKKYKILIFPLVIMLFASYAHAAVQESDILLNTSPVYPAPHQNVNIVINSYVTDLNRANIFWSVNGEEKASGFGKKSFSLTMGGIGSVTAVEARISTFDGLDVIKRVLLSPSEVDMLWEAYDSYSPPFYRGKTLVASEGTFKVVAMPNISAGGASEANNLSYIWTLDGEGQTDFSGWGKNSIMVMNNYLDKVNVAEVEVSDASGSTNVAGKVILQTSNPKIFLYHSNPELGINYAHAMENGSSVSKDGETIVAEPYFFSPKKIKPSSLDFRWYINGVVVPVANGKNMLSIKPDSGKNGTASIKVTVNNTKTLFQSLDKEINVSF